MSRHPTPVPPGTAPATSSVRQLRFDVGARPFLVLMELTRACRLACRHCRAEAQEAPDPDDLTSAEVRAVFDDLAGLGAPRPVVVLSGGDPLRRPDLTKLVRYATDRGLTVAVSPAGTPLASRARLASLRDAGVSTVSFSIDGGRIAHDGFRGVPGSFDWTVGGCRAARQVGLRLQINTTVSAQTVHDLPDVAEAVLALGASLWSVFFLVPVGRGTDLGSLSASETEDVLVALHEVSGAIPLKTTEAPQYRRIVLHAQRGAVTPTAERGPLYRELHRELARVVDARPLRPDLLARAPRPMPATGPARSTRAASGPPAPQGHGSTGDEAGQPRARSPLAVGDGRGVVFVSRRGDVYPSGFLPLVAGNVRERPLTDIYVHSPLFQALRDPGRLQGRCGRCEMAPVCGGSRSQAYAATGDPLAEDPKCTYVPEPASEAVKAAAGVGGPRLDGT